MPEEPTPDAILAAVSAAYRRFVEYEDAGVVAGDSVATVRFETRFRRGSLMRFSYAAILEDGRTFHDGEVGVDAGQFTFRCSLPAPQPSSLRLGIAALTGISSGAAHGVPSLLLPEEVGGWLPTDLRDPARLPDIVVHERACFQVEGQHPSQGGKHSLIVDKESFLVRRRISHEGRQVTDYEPCRAA